MSERYPMPAVGGGSTWKQAPAKNYILGLDLGKKNDYTALTVLERVTALSDDGGWLTRWIDPPQYHVTQIFRAPQRMPYPKQVVAVTANVRALQGLRPEPRISLVVDQTGVGQAVCDLLIDAELGCDLTFCTITGADSETHDRTTNEYRVPKRDLAAAVAVLLESDRLKYAAALPYLPELQKELTSFQVKVNPRTGHDSYGNATDWRSAEHDDLVLSLCLAAWWGEHDDRNDIGFEEVWKYYDYQLGLPPGTSAARAAQR